MRHIENVRQHSSATSVADHETSLESFEGSFGRKPHLQASIPLVVESETSRSVVELLPQSRHMSIAD